MASPRSIQSRVGESAPVPHYELFIGGFWTRSSRNATELKWVTLQMGKRAYPPLGL
ncbi:hypothetical protein KX816_15780 [Sphingosinicellaceae bacterium]|nr:hypothetical protein KX816_15780 [Sphingosinicellaceae bacterium]